MIVLDTNVISEVMRDSPDERVMSWLGRQKSLHLAVTTGKRRKNLEASFANFIARGFAGRVLSFDEAAAQIYGDMCAQREAKGLHADPVDLMIAAIVRTVRASLATRNTGDFEQCGIKLINPWQF